MAVECESLLGRSLKKSFANPHGLVVEVDVKREEKTKSNRFGRSHNPLVYLIRSECRIGR
jgi:hypothetical protein